MSFDVGADAYMRFMGQYSEWLAAQFADLAGIHRGQRVLDVGCGPGALTAELASRVGADAVSAVEPSAGAYLASLAPGRQAALRERCQRRLPAGPFEVSATAWAVTCMLG